MTIRLLSTWDGFPPGSIITLSSSEESHFIADGYATSDLTGGTVAYHEVEPLMVVPSQRMIGEVHLAGNQKSKIELVEGMSLTVQGSAGVAGQTHLVDTDGSSLAAPVDVVAGANPTIGPYSGTKNFVITCTAGSIDAHVGSAVLTQSGGSAYTLPVAATNRLGGIKPDGTTITVDAGGNAIAVQPTPYTLPVATTSILGGVKPDGTTIAADGNGVLSTVQQVVTSSAAPNNADGRPNGTIYIQTV